MANIEDKYADLFEMVDYEINNNLSNLKEITDNINGIKKVLDDRLIETILKRDLTKIMKENLNYELQTMKTELPDLSFSAPEAISELTGLLNSFELLAEYESNDSETFKRFKLGNGIITMIYEASEQNIGYTIRYNDEIVIYNDVSVANFYNSNILDKIIKDNNLSKVKYLDLVIFLIKMSGIEKDVSFGFFADLEGQKLCMISSFEFYLECDLSEEKLNGVKYVAFDISRYGKYNKTLKIRGNESVNTVCELVQAYFSVPLTKEHWEKYGDDVLFPHSGKSWEDVQKEGKLKSHSN